MIIFQVTIHEKPRETMMTPALKTLLKEAINRTSNEPIQIQVKKAFDILKAAGFNPFTSYGEWNSLDTPNQAVVVMRMNQLLGPLGFELSNGSYVIDMTRRGRPREVYVPPVYVNDNNLYREAMTASMAAAPTYSSDHVAMALHVCCDLLLVQCRCSQCDLAGEEHCDVCVACGYCVFHNVNHENNETRRCNYC